MKKKDGTKDKKEFKGDVMTKQNLFIPLNLWHEYLTYSKYLHGIKMDEKGGSVWKVMKYGMELIKREEAKKDSENEERLRILEDRLQQLENEVYNKQSHKNETVLTFAD